jgi:hypothetical protein
MANEYLQIIKQSLSNFEPISLAEMDCVSLMDRMDTKFVLTIDTLKDVIIELDGNYRVLTINDNQVFSYRTDYYDTPDLSMFLDHHNGKLNRFKIRQRDYVESNLSFLEIKFKSNKGRVIKDRIKRSPNDKKLFTGFIQSHSPYNPHLLKSTLINHFNRFTLVDKKQSERVTTDFNLAFNDNIQQVSLNGLVVVEIKQDNFNKDSMIYKLLREKSLRPSPMSKYCIGISLLHNEFKTNNFKETILKINKISHVELIA